MQPGTKDRILNLALETAVITLVSGLVTMGLERMFIRPRKEKRDE